jgi:hypothetical protein
MRFFQSQAPDYDKPARMRKVCLIAVMVPLLASAAMPALANGWRHGGRADARYAVGTISRNVITPWYYGYYGSHYSYFRPDPSPPRSYVIVPQCWAWGFGDRYWIC